MSRSPVAAVRALKISDGAAAAGEPAVHTAPAFTPGCGAGCGKSHAPLTDVNTTAAIATLRGLVGLRAAYFAAAKGGGGDAAADAAADAAGEADDAAVAESTVIKGPVPASVVRDLGAVWAAARDPAVRAFCDERLQLLELGFARYKLEARREEHAATASDATDFYRVMKVGTTRRC